MAHPGVDDRVDRFAWTLAQNGHEQQAGPPGRPSPLPWEGFDQVDAGISGSKGRDKRPAFDRMLKDAVRGKFDILAAWAVDRLGRSLPDLVSSLGELRAAGVDLFLHQQAVDTTTPSGRAMFQMLGVFAEFERAIIQERVKAGLKRARAKGKVLGRPRLHADEEGIREAVEGGLSIRKTAQRFGG